MWRLCLTTPTAACRWRRQRWVLGRRVWGGDRANLMPERCFYWHQAACRCAVMPCLPLRTPCEWSLLPSACTCPDFRCRQVRLRRSIGMKKDDYYLDKKHIT